MAKQLTIEERESISRMQASGHSTPQIAAAIGRHRSTINRELVRNSCDQGYRAIKAQQLAEARRRERPLLRKMDDPQVRDRVISLLVQFWAPEQIAGRSAIQCGKALVSHQTLYMWIKNEENRQHWESFLRHRGRNRPADDRRGQIPKQVKIKDRPAIVDERKRRGDWEGDTVVGGKKSGCIVTLVDRKTGFLIAAKTPDRTADRVGSKIVHLLEPLDRSRRHTLTLDNGKEFATHNKVTSKLKLPIYFARPYCSFERGTNENTNGLLRQFVPKKTDLREVSHQQLGRYVDMMNDRPRKRLGYKTPRELFDPDNCVAIEI